MYNMNVSFLLPVEINLTVAMFTTFFISFKSIFIFYWLTVYYLNAWLVSLKLNACMTVCVKMMIKLVIFKLVLNKLLEEVKMTVHYVFTLFPTWIYDYWTKVKQWKSTKCQNQHYNHTFTIFKKLFEELNLLVLKTWTVNHNLLKIHKYFISWCLYKFCGSYNLIKNY